ncbi:MAG TPA: ABC transporter permease [Vicinamibacterales bacterium]
MFARFIVRRLCQAVPLLLVVSLLVFLLIHAAPGGPLTLYLSNPNVRPQDIERLRRALGLDRPLWIQYLSWLGAFVRGDWGYSYADGRPVLERIIERLPATLELVASSMALGALIAMPVGVIAAIRRHGWFDRLTAALASAGISLPVFWFGLVLQIVFSVWLGWLPSSGRSTLGGSGLVDRLEHLAMPTTVLALVHAAAWSRYLRASMGDVLGQPYIAAARARGVPAWSVWLRHALRNAVIPVLTVAMIDAAIMVSGAVVTESVFAWPGVGSLFTDALAKRDYTVLMAFLMMSSCAVVVLNLGADLLHRRLDPRIGSGAA